MGIGTAAAGGGRAAQAAHKGILMYEAGSGGYMVGTGVDKIVAQGDTLGGSLDILGGGLRVGGSLVNARVISRWADEGFDTFEDFKKVHGAAGEGNAWHHIVEQNPSNVEKFGATQIHNTKNLVKVPHGTGSVHAEISGYYSSKRPFTGGMTVRDWLSTKSYEEQFKFGMKILKRFGG